MAKMMRDGKEVAIAGEKFMLPSVLHLVALKLHSIKNSGKTRELFDLPDIIMVLKKNNVNVNDKAFKKICLKFGTEDLYKKIVDFFQ